MGEVKHTPGPWKLDVVPAGAAFGTASGRAYGVSSTTKLGLSVPVIVWRGVARPASAEGQANARLIAAAPDHALIAAALCSGAARWDRTEFCIGGIRHSTKLDEFGVPIMTHGMRAAIARATQSPATEGGR